MAKKARLRKTTKKPTKAKRKAAPRAAASKKSGKVGRPKIPNKPPTILFNMRLLKAALAEAQAKAKKHFKGNMSAFVRAALHDWKPRRSAA